jgi:hypothetical protein
VADTHTGIVVPEDVSTVGWWLAGAAPEDPTGTTVLVGHVDAWDQGPGALYALDRARAGTPVEVATGDGQVTRWAVTSLRVVPVRAAAVAVRPGHRPAAGADHLGGRSTSAPATTWTTSWSPPRRCPDHPIG